MESSTFTNLTSKVSYAILQFKRHISQSDPSEQGSLNYYCGNLPVFNPMAILVIRLKSMLHENENACLTCVQRSKAKRGIARYRSFSLGISARLIKKGNRIQ